MAKERRDTYLKDPVGSRAIINEMPSGLNHTADSLSGDRTGRLVMKYGSPGDPLGYPTVEPSGFLGNVPNLSGKFLKKGQR